MVGQDKDVGAEGNRRGTRSCACVVPLSGAAAIPDWWAADRSPWGQPERAFWCRMGNLQPDV